MKDSFYEDVHKYLNNRIKDSQKYRGMHLVQHQRLPLEKLEVILKAVYSAAKNDFFIEPSGDDPSPTGKSHQIGDSRRFPAGNISSDCDKYWEILDYIAINGDDSIGATFNSLKKNTFPNLIGMGLLERKTASGSDSRKYARLTDIATKFLEGDSRTKLKIYSECNERILSPMINVLDETLKNFDTVNVYEMMLFLTDEQIPVTERIQLLSKYKRLKLLKITQLHTSLKTQMAKSMHSSVAKIDKQDWHNWWNESKQMTQMLSTVVGFNVYENELIMQAGNVAAAAFTVTRSQKVKGDAMRWHNIPAREGWELHHIVPLEYATGMVDLGKLDNKKNLLYIPGSTHKKIPNRSNLMVELLVSTNNRVSLGNPLSTSKEPRLDLTIGTDVLFEESNLNEMLTYNRELIELIAGT